MKLLKSLSISTVNYCICAKAQAPLSLGVRRLRCPAASLMGRRRPANWEIGRFSPQRSQRFCCFALRSLR
ncbi:MAG: hypothetical protein OIN90_12310 [Candidatus Methanoperedens sp.]|nr:hypothetical protein [Candidatus Methanoperedens sp.]